jgi:hypothetical protein
MKKRIIEQIIKARNIYKAFFLLIILGGIFLSGAAAKADGTSTLEIIASSTAPLPKASIKLRIETASSTLYNDNLEVMACENFDGSGVYDLNGRCALEQSGLAAKWTNWGSDLFLDSIGDIANNQNGNGIYWNWFDGLSYGQTALNKHVLHEGEDLLLTYEINPLKLMIATNSPLIGSTTILSLDEFAFDTSWNPVWQPAASSSFFINGEQFFSADGTWILSINTSTPYSIYGVKAGFLNSQTEIITGTSTLLDAEAEGGDQAGVSGVGYGGTQEKIFDTAKAISFLAAHQNSDGSIGSSIIFSDWAAIAFSAYGDSGAKDKLRDYLLSAGYDTALKVGTTDLDRRAMALMALGVNPYNTAGADYISRIAAAFDGRQIGDPNYFNDDIFSLFPLLKAGFNGNDKIISDTLQFVISNQETNGSWGSVDISSAAISALALARQAGNINSELSLSINQSLQSGRQFLQSVQMPNGGFNDNVNSTAWAAQAISALGDPVSAWEKFGLDPIDYLAGLQEADGGLESQTAPIDTRIWTTAYAIPAALNKSWGDILFNFARPENFPAEFTALENQTEATSTLPESAMPATTTVPEIPENYSTSAPEILIINPVPDVFLPAKSIEEAKNEPKIKLAGPKEAVAIKPVKKYSASVRPKLSFIEKSSPKITKETKVLGEDSAAVIEKNLPPQAPESPIRDYAKIILYFSLGALVLIGVFAGLGKK